MLANDPAARRLGQRVRVCTGGALPFTDTITQMERLDIELVHLYGLTETYGPLSDRELAELERAAGRTVAEGSLGYALIVARKPGCSC